ncbi:MAG: PAS domain S-box protein [Chloroflexi bacterium]|nr:PAS domain S-box protein [Chloroflexota bacterium]
MGGKLKIHRYIITGLLLLLCIGLDFYFRFVLNIQIVYTHLFYIPIVLAAIWWGLKGGLGASLLLSIFYMALNIPGFDLAVLSRAVIFIVVGIIVGALRDRYRGAEVAMEESEERYRRFFITSTDCAYITDKEGHIIDINDTGAGMFGYKNKEEILNINVSGLYADPDDRKKFMREMDEKGFIKNMEVDFKRKDGTLVPILLTSVGIKDDKGEITRYQGTMRDITERKKFIQALKDSEERYRHLLDNMPDTVITIDLEGNFTFVSPMGEKLSGYPVEKLLKMNMFDVIAPEYRSMVREKLDQRVKEGMNIPPYEAEIIDSRGEKVWVQILTTPIRDPGGSLVGVQAIARNISDLKNMEKQFIQSQKMEAVGNLAGGLAHDFNNILSAILLNIHRVKRKLGQDDPAVPILNTVEDSTQRAAEMIKQLLQFARPKKFEEKAISLNVMVEESLRLIRAAIPSTIELETRLAEKPCLIKGDPSAITQIVTNLSVNARDAMPDGGKLTFETTLVSLDDSYCRTHFDAKPGNYCLLKVSDTGVGIPPENLERIFEPFFTTKETGTGTGLGLPMVYSVTKHMGGWVEVSSRVGNGTEFKIYLPESRE